MSFSLTLVIFSSIAVTSCVFLASYFLFIKKDHRLKDMSLGLLFVAIAFRIAKSIFYYALPEISALGIGMGFIGFASIGPLALTYYKVNRTNQTKLKSRVFFHLIIPVIGFVIILLKKSLAYDMYFIANISFVCYLSVIAYKFIYKLDNVEIKKWHKTLFYALLCLSIILIFQLFGETMKNYTLGIILASGVLYFLFFYALKSPIITKKPSSESLPENLLEKIRITIEDDKIYIQPAITLTQFAEAIDTPTYLISKATKIIYNKSFPEVINYFRIKAITEKLSQLEYANEKIEDLAYDVGFNTSSAFYNAFKKETTMSPRAYQKKMLNQY